MLVLARVDPSLLPHQKQTVRNGRARCRVRDLSSHRRSHRQAMRRCSAAASRMSSRGDCLILIGTTSCGGVVATAFWAFSSMALRTGISLASGASSKVIHLQGVLPHMADA